MRERALDLTEIVGAESNIGGAEILLEAMKLRGPGNRREPRLARQDPREVISDPHGRYYGIAVSERTLVPNDDARLGKTRFEDWLQATKPVQKTRPQRA